MGFGLGNERNISNFRRVYGRISGDILAASSFYDRFDISLVRFLRTLLLIAIRNLKTSWFETDERLKPFQDILITDSTLVKLDDKLAKKFPGTRTNHSPASAKLHAVFSVKGKGGSTIALSAGRVHDKKKLKIGSWVCDRLMLFDANNHDHSMSQDSQDQMPGKIQYLRDLQ